MTIVRTAGVALLVAGPAMIAQGWCGRTRIKAELEDQEITFPGPGEIPAGLAGYAGQRVNTGEQAKAYSDLIATHLEKATGGRTYSEVSEEWIAGGRTDENLDQLRQTAFMGQSLRSALLGAYLAWQISLLVSGLGALLTGIGLAFLAIARTPHGGG